MELSTTEPKYINKVNATEVHVSSSFGSTVEKKNKKMAEAIKAVENGQRSNPLEKYRLDIKETIFEEPFELIKKSLHHTYLLTGIELKDDDFPSVAIYNMDEKPVAKACQNTVSGKSGFGDRVDLFPVGGNNLLAEISLLHHETDHHIGRQVAVSRLIDKNLFGIIKYKETDIRTVQLGLSSYLQKGDERGLVLEEGIVEYLAHDFVLSSDDEIIKEARKDYLVGTEVDLEGLDDYSIKEICKKTLTERSPQRYVTAKVLIETLIEGARKLSEDEAREMKKDMLKTRIETKNMRSLMDRVDRIFGDQTFTKIYHLKFNGDEENEEKNKKFVIELRQKVELN